MNVITRMAPSGPSITELSVSDRTETSSDIGGNDWMRRTFPCFDWDPKHSLVQICRNEVQPTGRNEVPPACCNEDKKKVRRKTLCAKFEGITKQLETGLEVKKEKPYDWSTMMTYFSKEFFQQLTEKTKLNPDATSFKPKGL